MRLVLAAVFVLNVVFLISTLAFVPGRVAIHFGPGGMPDSYASSMTNVVIFILATGLILAIGLLVPLAVRKTPVQLLSIPNRDYWMRPENQELFYQKFGSLMAQFALGMLIFFIWVEILVTMANASPNIRLNEHLFYPGLIAIFVYIFFWIYRLITTLRIPEPKQQKS